MTEPLTVIEPRRPWQLAPLGELLAARDLAWFLVWRDLKVRYKQTFFGVAWAVLQPVLGAAIFSLVFSRLIGSSSAGVPYPVFAYAGMVAWSFVAQGVTLSAMSLVQSVNLLQKVYFPRLLIPATPVVASLLDLVLATALLALVTFGLGHGSAATVPLVVPAGLMLLATALGCGFWLATLNVRYRDVKYAVPFLIQAWMFASPVVYPVTLVERQLAELGLPAWIWGVNPTVGGVELFRLAFFGACDATAATIVASAVVAVGLLLSGMMVLQRSERWFADVV